MNKKIKYLLWSLPLTLLLLVVAFAYVKSLREHELPEFGLMLSWFPQLLGLILSIFAVSRIFVSEHAFEDLAEHKGSIMILLIGACFFHWSGALALVCFYIGSHLVESRKS